MKANLSIQILPGVQDDREVTRIVDEVIDYIRSTGLHYYVGPSETAIEGDDLHQLMEIAENCMQVAARADSEKTSAYMKLIWRPEGKVLTIDEKVVRHHQ